MKCLLALATIIVLQPAVVSAWGVEGHAVVAEVATMRLSDVAKAQVARLLSPGESLASVASWADEVRHRRPETAQWHFVDIPRAEPTYSATRDCPVTPTLPEGSCVVGAIKHFKQILADPTKPDAERTEALKWVVHFVGDLHQPLHCSDNHDRGGNQVTVRFFKAVTNLHAVWDSGIITKVGITEIDYARHLDAWLKSQNVAALEAGIEERWAEESHKAADQHSYKIPANHRLGGTYFDANEPVVDEQLAKGGVRLVRILNEALR